MPKKTNKKKKCTQFKIQREEVPDQNQTRLKNLKQRAELTEKLKQTRELKQKKRQIKQMQKSDLQLQRMMGCDTTPQKMTKPANIMRNVVQTVLPNPFVQESAKQRHDEIEIISIRDSTVPPVAVGEPEDTQPISHNVVAPSIQIEIEDDIIPHRVDPCIQVEIEDDILEDLI